jgi:hypothetical protein
MKVVIEAAIADPKIPEKTFFEEMNAFIVETRKLQTEEAAMSISRLNLIKKSKG